MVSNITVAALKAKYFTNLLYEEIVLRVLRMWAHLSVIRASRGMYGRLRTLYAATADTTIALAWRVA